MTPQEIFESMLENRTVFTWIGRSPVETEITRISKEDNKVLSINTACGVIGPPMMFYKTAQRCAIGEILRIAEEHNTDKDNGTFYIKINVIQPTTESEKTK